MRRATVLGLALMTGAAGILIAGQEKAAEPRLAAGEKPPFINFGRREIPDKDDAYFLRDLSIDALGERIEKGDPKDFIPLTYTLLVWHTASLLAADEESERRRIYAEAENAYLSILAADAHAPSPDPRLESNAHFLIGVAWVAWKASLDPLARARLQKCASLKQGQYRIAAEMLAEKTPYRPGLEEAVARLLDGNAASALDRIDEVLRKQPDHPTANYWRGVALQRLARHEQALASFDAYLKVDATNVAALEARAASHYARKDWKKAAADWEAAIALDPVVRGRLQPWLEAVREAGK